MHLKKPAGCKISRLFLFPVLIISCISSANQPSPFPTRNQSPFSLIFGIPLASPAKLLNHKQSRWINSLNISNTLTAQTGSNDALLVDIETTQLNFLYDYSFKENWMLRLQLPYILHSGGFLDSSIDSYHDALSLPEGKRPYFPRDQINVRYIQNNTLQLSIDDDQKSIGDISIQLAWQAQQSNDQAISYWLSLKLPSGDEEKLTGSGSSDIAAWTSLNYRLNQTRWLYGQAGVLYMSDGEVMQSIQKNWAVFATSGIKFEPWENVELKAQLDMHSAPYDSDIEFLGHVIQATFGGSYHINPQNKLDFAIVEDIKEEASPDVNFNISWWINY